MTSTTNIPAKRHTGQFSDETERELMASRIATLEEKVEKIEHDRDQALLWGIRTLGGLLLGLGIWVYNLISVGRH